MSESNYKVQLERTLDQISAARAIWEEGTLKSSNDELYAILERCFDIYREMKEDTAKETFNNN